MNQLTTIIDEKHLAEQNINDALQVIETRNKLFDRVMATAIQSTCSVDWIDQDGRPYLQASGAEKVARRFGVKVYDVRIDREDLEDESGKYVIYTTSGKAALGSNEFIEAIGTCSSRDKFFGKKDGKFKSLAQVDLPNVKKKSYTNFFANVVTRLLGIRNLSWADLFKYGITASGKTTVKYSSNNTVDIAYPTPSQNTAESGKSSAPYWFSNHKGKDYLFAKVGAHFSKEYLENLGFKQSKSKEDIFYRDPSDRLVEILKEEFQAAEETLSMQGG